jgi:hypothetical protein
MACHIRDGFQAVLTAERPDLIEVDEMMDQLQRTLSNTQPSGTIINGKKLHATLQ